ncbi:putative transposase [Trichonephila clavipes]|nr:putative transposase [Trichonephila clavipes]
MAFLTTSALLQAQSEKPLRANREVWGLGWLTELVWDMSEQPWLHNDFTMRANCLMTFVPLKITIRKASNAPPNIIPPPPYLMVEKGFSFLRSVQEFLQKFKLALLSKMATDLTAVNDEAHFWLNGYVNKQNCRIWSEANPQVYVETPLHPEKLTVWCALWAGGIIGPSFKNDEGHNVTVGKNGGQNGDRYRAMITNFFIPELNNHDVQELWFQQDGATCHTARATIDLLKDTFGDRLISRFGPVNWPPRSCDLTPLDYFLWDYVKSFVYADKPPTLDHLEDNIRRVIADIRPQLLEKVIENWTSRLDYIRASRGSPMPEIIFKM